jgi:hypothetical protein
MIKLHEKETYSLYQILELEHWGTYLKENTAILTEKFKKIIEKYNFENLKNLEGEEKDIIRFELFHGSGSLDFTFSAYTETNELSGFFKELYLFPEYIPREPYCNFEYPENLDVYWERYKDYKFYDEQRNILFTWLIEIWHKCGGHRCGVLCGTFENNAAKVFNLTQMHWQNYIEKEIEPQKGVRVDYPLSRDLTIQEIHSRVLIDEYSKNTYLWRYYEKNDEFAEIGLFRNYIVRRSGGIKNFDEVPFSTQIIKNDYYDFGSIPREQISNFCDDMVNNGYFEKNRPSEYPKMIDENLDWLISYSKFTTKDEVINFQKKEKVVIPFEYLRFLIFNEGVNLQNMVFRKDKDTSINITMFYSFKEMMQERQSQIEKGMISLDYLAIAEDYSKNLILIRIEESKSSMYFWKKNTNELEKISDDFDFFIDNLHKKYEFHPKLYHIEKGNVFMIRKWITEGWDVNEKISGSSAAIGLSTNDEITELLLQHGADTSQIKLKPLYRIKPKYLQILVDYGVDINLKLSYLEKVELLKNDDFKKFHTLIQIK